MMNILQGIGASRGFAFGLAHFYLPMLPVLLDTQVEDPASEIIHLDQAVSQVESELENLQSLLEQRTSTAEAMVFEAHRMFLHDPLFYDEICRRVEDGLNAPKAIEQVMGNLRQTFEAMKDEYFRQRAGDIVDVGNRLIRRLLDLPQPNLQFFDQPGIIVAAELLPSDTAQMDTTRVLGIVTAHGGPTAHAAIFARSLGIPAVVGVGFALLDLPSGCRLILDGEAGQVVVDPDEKTFQIYTTRHREETAVLEKAIQEVHHPARTMDGKVVEVVANIGQVGEAAAAIEQGAEGVGLLRTEFLYLDRTTAPSEDEQYENYLAIADTFGKMPVVIRTLDIGGDKQLPYVTQDAEDNPFLGLRGLRLCLTMPDLLKCQLRAILRAAVGHNLKIMFPMVSTLYEIRQANQLLTEARLELDARRILYADVEVGIMVEVPAAAVAADLLAHHVDFFSIGTNDLTQYTMAADRTNRVVQNLADAFHPAVLRLIQNTIQSGHSAGIWVGLCGELAGDPLAVPLLLGMHLDEFSMSRSSIPLVKQAIRRWSIAHCEQITRHALQLEDAQAVRAYLHGLS